MLSYDELPEDNADLAKIKVTFPFLVDNSPKSCPSAIDEIQEYLSRESPDKTVTKSRPLNFLRTAKVGQTDYWIWSFRESDGARAYVTVSRGPDGVDIGYSPDFYNLTPEQFILGDYHEVF
jgi:hypothetical protein